MPASSYVIYKTSGVVEKHEYFSVKIIFDVASSVTLLCLDPFILGCSCFSGTKWTNTKVLGLCCFWKLRAGRNKCSPGSWKSRHLLHFFDNPNFYNPTNCHLVKSFFQCITVDAKYDRLGMMHILKPSSHEDFGFRDNRFWRPYFVKEPDVRPLKESCFGEKLDTFTESTLLKMPKLCLPN